MTGLNDPLNTEFLSKYCYVYKILTYRGYTRTRLHDVSGSHPTDRSTYV